MVSKSEAKNQKRLRPTKNILTGSDDDVTQITNILFNLTGAVCDSGGDFLIIT